VGRPVSDVPDGVARQDEAMTNEPLDRALVKMREAQDELAQSIPSGPNAPQSIDELVEMIALNAANLSLATADVVRLLARALR
jgi:hypothetical protein